MARHGVASRQVANLRILDPTSRPRESNFCRIKMRESSFASLPRCPDQARLNREFS